MPIYARRGIALIAHDRRKNELCEWAVGNVGALARHRLYATESTGTLILARTGIPVRLFRSGPYGGDQQIGAAIVDGRIDVLIFFWDPLATMAHQADVQALLRLAVLFDIVTASNRATADLLAADTQRTPLQRRDANGVRGQRDITDLQHRGTLTADRASVEVQNPDGVREVQRPSFGVLNSAERSPQSHPEDRTAEVTASGRL